MQRRAINLINKFIDKHKVSNYRGVNITSLLKISLYWYIMFESESKFIHESQNSNIDKKIVEKIKKHIRIDYIKCIKFLAIDILKSLSKLGKNNCSKCNVLISIDNYKFLKYVKPIVEKIETNGLKVVLYIWDSAKINNEEIHSYYSREIKVFPRFWNKNYWKYRNLTVSIDSALACLKKYKPEKVIVIEGDNEYQHIFGYLSNVYKYESICLQWGYVGTETTKMGWRNMPFNKMLVWGKFFKEKFSIHNSDMIIVPVGHHLLREKEQSNKDTILFAVQKEMFPYITKKNIEDFIQIAIELSKTTKYRVRVRSHPNYEIDNSIIRNNPQIDWHNYKNNEIIDSLNNAIVCITISSTLALEAICYNVFPLYLKLGNKSLQIHEDLKNVCKEINIVLDKEDLQETIEFIDKNKLTIDNPYFYHSYNQDAINNIINEIQSI
jgi:hypothetical protein